MHSRHPGNGEAVIRDLIDEKQRDWYNRAVGLLARREHSANELARKLREKGAPEDQIDSILLALKQNGYQSDTRFAESYVRHRVEAGFGPVRIRAELLQRGVESALIDQSLNQPLEFWQNQLKGLWQRRFHGKLPQNQQEYGRQVRFLLQRGFMAEQVRKLIQQRK